MKRAAPGRGRPRVLFVAGEASGDHHAAAVVRALGPRAVCYGLGGPEMAAAGLRLDLDLASRSVIGFVEVLRHLAYFRRAFRTAERLLREERPDVLVLVDYPGFNLRLAAKARALGIPVVYYISPQVWAWKRGRVPAMARTLRKMLVTFPFEKPIYDAAGLDCELVGHPLLDAIAPSLRPRGLGDPSPARLRALRRGRPWAAARTVVGLLPGSREQEVRHLLPVMLESAERLRAERAGLAFVVVRPASAPDAWYAPVDRARRRGLELHLVAGEDAADAYRIRAGFDAALVASGTATLETALLGTPFCILYRVHPLTYAAAKRLVKIHSIGLANVVAGRRVVPEFLQGELKAPRIAEALGTLLDDPAARRAQREGLAPGLGALGKPGVAGRVARCVLEVAERDRAPRA